MSWFGRGEDEVVDSIKEVNTTLSKQLVDLQEEHKKLLVKMKESVEEKQKLSEICTQAQKLVDEARDKNETLHEELKVKDDRIKSLEAEVEEWEIEYNKLKESALDLQNAFMSKLVDHQAQSSDILNEFAQKYEDFKDA